MMEKKRNFSPAVLRFLFRLIPQGERATALNLRSHNPVDVEMVGQVQAYVDGVLGIGGDAFFKSSDGLRFAALKGIRNILAAQVKHLWVSRWFFTAADDHSLDSLAGYLDGLYASPKVRQLRAAGLPRVFVLVLLLVAKRLERPAAAARAVAVRGRELLTGSFVSRRKGGGENGAAERSTGKRPRVLVLTSLFHPIVNFTVKAIVDELEKRHFDIVLAFHDGLDAKQLRSDDSRGWCARMPAVPLPGGQGCLGFWRTLVTSPRSFYSTALSIGFALNRARETPSSDWGMRWLLVRKVPFLIAGFHSALFQAQRLISQFKPISVLNCDNGSENLHVKAFAYHCLKKGIRFYRYKPVPFFPVRQPAFNSVSRFMIVTPDDAQIFRDNGSSPELWDVGSPILDLAGPFVAGEQSRACGRNGAGRERIKILFFTKRDFPNRAILAAMSSYCAQSGRPATLTVKFHPSDARQFELDPPAGGGLVEIVYHGKEEIELVDRLIFESDIVVSGSSNVIWSAFAQFKPVVYLAFQGMSSETHVSGYGRYATSDFLVASAIEGIGDSLGRLIDGARRGGILKHFERHESLMRNFFCNGEFNSTERIFRILSDRV